MITKQNDMPVQKYIYKVFTRYIFIYIRYSQDYIYMYIVLCSVLESKSFLAT